MLVLFPIPGFNFTYSRRLLNCSLSSGKNTNHPHHANFMLKLLDSHAIAKMFSPSLFVRMVFRENDSLQVLAK